MKDACERRRLHYDRHWCYLTGILGCSLDEMAHGDYIGIVAYHQDGILEGLTLGGAGCLGIRETNDTGTKTVGSGLETELGTSRWLEEKGRYDLSFNNSLFGCFSNSCAISGGT